MEESAEAVAAYEAALPTDDRVERKRMFGVPCAFVNRQMFFGTFGPSVIARVGPKRVATLVAQPGMKVFVPTEGKPWEDYVQVETFDDAALLTTLAAEAMTWTLRVPTGKKLKDGKKPASGG